MMTTQETIRSWLIQEMERLLALAPEGFPRNSSQCVYYSEITGEFEGNMLAYGVVTVEPPFPGSPSFTVLNCKKSIRHVLSKIKSGYLARSRDSSPAKKSVSGGKVSFGKTGEDHLAFLRRFEDAKDKAKQKDDRFKASCFPEKGESFQTDGHRLLCLLSGKRSGDPFPAGCYRDFNKIIPGYVEGGLPCLEGRNSFAIKTEDIWKELKIIEAFYFGIDGSKFVRIAASSSGLSFSSYKTDVGSVGDCSGGKLIGWIDFDCLHDCVLFFKNAGEREIVFSHGDRFYNPYVITGKRSYAVAAGARMN